MCKIYFETFQGEEQDLVRGIINIDEICKNADTSVDYSYITIAMTKEDIRNMILGIMEPQNLIDIILRKVIVRK